MRKTRVLLISAAFAVLAVAQPALAGPTTYTYDGLGRVKTATYDNGYQVTYSYDANGNRTVVSQNAPPIANSQSVTTPNDKAATITLSGSDPEGEALSYSIVTWPVHGSLSGTPPNMTYVVGAGFTAGTDSFTFKVSDPVATSSPATVSITVTNPSDCPSENVTVGSGSCAGTATLPNGSLGATATVDGPLLQNYCTSQLQPNFNAASATYSCESTGWTLTSSSPCFCEP